MKIINEIVTPLTEEKNIDINELKKIIKESKMHNDYQLLFANFGDGAQLSSSEIIETISNLDDESNDVFLFFQLKNIIDDKKYIKLLNHSKIRHILISPPNDLICSQTGLFMYLRETIKLFTNKKIYLYNGTNIKTNLTFHSIKKLYKLFQNSFEGIYENSSDTSLMSLIKINLPSLKLYVNERHLEFALKNDLDGIISISSFIYHKDFHSIISDYKLGYINKIAIEYLLFVNDILTFTNNSTILKAYLKHLGYNSMNVRLPLLIDNNDIDNLELLLA